MQYCAVGSLPAAVAGRATVRRCPDYKDILPATRRLSLRKTGLPCNHLISGVASPLPAVLLQGGAQTSAMNASTLARNTRVIRGVCKPRWCRRKCCWLPLRIMEARQNAFDDLEQAGYDVRVFVYLLPPLARGAGEQVFIVGSAASPRPLPATPGDGQEADIQISAPVASYPQDEWDGKAWTARLSHVVCLTPCTLEGLPQPRTG